MHRAAIDAVEPILNSNSGVAIHRPLQDSKRPVQPNHAPLPLNETTSPRRSETSFPLSEIEATRFLAATLDETIQSYWPRFLFP
jgi:hypothetical protein